MIHFIQRLHYLFIVLLFSLAAHAQGPSRSYYFHPATELSWAECTMHQPGGSQQKIPFMSAVDWATRAPTGIGKYTGDVDVDAPLVFIGNGIVHENGWNSYHGRRLDYVLGDIDVTGKAVLFCTDFPDSIEVGLEEKMSIERRIAEAASRHAAAVLLFSHRWDYPFVGVDSRKESGIGNVPVISITEPSAADILSSAGEDGAKILEDWEVSGKTRSLALISRVRLRIRGRFENIDTEHFSIRFRKDRIPEKDMEVLSEVNEKALQFLFKTFRDVEGIRWDKLMVVYFSGYDSKYFYTHHRGHGMACDAGVFNVYRGGALDFGLAVHENTHSLTYLNWGGSSSFMDEGMAKYTEALATDKDSNHRETVQFLKDGVLFPLEEMLAFSIGVSGIKTNVGYPASGSFVGFLVDRYGLESVKAVYILEGRSEEAKKTKDTWTEVFGKFVSEMDREWRDWLLKNYR